MAKNNRVSIMGNRSHDKKSGVERYTYTEIQFPRDHKPDINDKYQDLTNRYIYMDIKCTAISYADRTHKYHVRKYHAHKYHKTLSGKVFELPKRSSSWVGEGSRHEVSLDQQWWFC